ncbi:hypothetical protein A6S26_06645 [Nostoc sp. ATCC 43529]|nr:hypothetical protein A6S26_06645 [Nostoc sp. ATCC 43529]
MSSEFKIRKFFSTQQRHLLSCGFRVSGTSRGTRKGAVAPQHSAFGVLKGYRCEMPAQILPPVQQSRLALRTVIGK